MPEIDDRSATPGVFRRINSPKMHNNRRIIPVVKLLANATYHANSSQLRRSRPLLPLIHPKYVGSIILNINATRMTNYFVSNYQNDI